MISDPTDHPFVKRPHATMFALSLPVLISMIAEPLTGIADTAFIAQTGAVPLAALGVGVTALSSIFWIFNFLQIGTQTEIARQVGTGATAATAATAGLALALSGLIGLVLALLGWLAAPLLARAMGAEGELAAQAVSYMHWRAPGIPAVMLLLACFGVLRGLQSMQLPLQIAVAINLINIALNGPLIFGWFGLPAMGVAGAALASSISQWIGAIWVLVLIWRRLGPLPRPQLAAAGRLLVVGGDLFVRTGLLIGFLLLATRLATLIGAEAGAINQAIRQIWFFTALFLDAFAITGQSLVGYFIGAKAIGLARRAAAITCAWSLAVGAALTVAMLVGQGPLEALLIPPELRGSVGVAWLIAALTQPLNALAFATDGVHWGTGDFGYLRNVMIVASLVGGGGLALIAPQAPWALTAIWVVTALWIATRAALGVARIWPGIGAAPLTPRA